MKKVMSFILCLCIFSVNFVYASTEFEVISPSAILLDLDGNIIFEKNAHQQREPASVTKIMTMLLAMEAIDRGEITIDDIVTVSQTAKEQGGTQVYLQENEQITVDELLKCIAVSSANDGATALGEYISGTREKFVELMNKRALELGMENTHFENPTGLSADGHVTTAYDISLMSLELLKHEKIYAYTTIWQDSIRNGEFELTNTNKLLKSYEGTVGLKTGYTSNAMYCISAVATRNEQTFIAVLMGAESFDIRTQDVTKMLDYAFENFKSTKLIYTEQLNNIIIQNGEQEELEIGINYDNTSILLDKNTEITHEINIPETLEAPIKKEQKVGEIIFKNQDEQEILKCDIVALHEVEKMTYKLSLIKFLNVFFNK